MAANARYRILLLDPVKLRRDRAEHGLRLRFDIEGASSVTEALAAGEANPPSAIVITLRQVDGNGLVAGKALRAKLGKDVFIVVHGAAEGRKTTAADRNRVAEHHGVDVWSESALESEQIEAVVGTELVRRNRPPPPPKPTLLERARAITKEDVKEFLTKDRPLIKTPPRSAGEEPGWIELLNAPPTAENLKKLLTKDIGGRKKAQAEG